MDTGFTDYLTLPPAAIAAMGLAFFYRIPAGLADNSVIELSVHLATIVWSGAEIDVPVLATGRRPLLGTGLLDGSEFVAQFQDGGLVTVDKL